MKWQTGPDYTEREREPFTPSAWDILVLSCVCEKLYAPEGNQKHKIGVNVNVKHSLQWAVPL